MKITKIGNRTLWRALCAVFILVLILGVAGDIVTKGWSGYINAVLGVSNTKVVTDENAEPVDSDYYKSDYDKPEDLKSASVAAAKEIQAEGTVLLTNKNNALPLAKNSKVTYLSYGMVDPIICRGTKVVDLIDANNGKLDANMTAYNFYKAKFESGYKATTSKGVTSLTRKTGGGFGAGAKPATASLPEIPANEFSSEMTQSFDTYNDAAIFVYTRNASEGSDLVLVDETVKNGRYLALSDEEKLRQGRVFAFHNQ